MGSGEWNRGPVYGIRRKKTPLVRAHLLSTALVAPAFMPTIVVPSLGAMAGLAVLAGLPVAPYFALRDELITRTAPLGSATEALSWPLLALLFGAGLGATLAGAIAQASGPHAAFLFSTARAAFGLLVALPLRRIARRAIG